LVNYTYRIDFATQEDSRRNRHYNHAQCLDKMIDLIGLTQSKFITSRDYSLSWAMMIRKWSENQGCINLDKIIDYMKTHDIFQEERKEDDVACNEWYKAHAKCKNETQGSRMGLRRRLPLMPERLGKPVLVDHVTSQTEKRGQLEL